MKHIYFLLFLLPVEVSGQLASDFSVSDIYGRAHSNDIHTAKDLWIAPNPSIDFLNVWAQVPPTGKVSIGIYNILGRRLYAFEPELQDEPLLLHEDASTWISGTYLVRIESDGKVLKTMRFVKR